ncbi:septum formation initiator family protein [Candidatus Saccharibacteria bacterium]|nr:septum formation initiator family protein [Candidatus Saccharibacteria bacterium]
MFTKIKNIFHKSKLEQFKDVRVISLIFFAVIVLLVSWNSVNVIQTNYELQKQIARMEQENEVKKLENENQKLKNQYYNTDQFLELQARRQFGKAAPGETLILVPKEVALSKTVDEPQENSSSKTQLPSKSTFQKNFESWMNFFLLRN